MVFIDKYNEHYKRLKVQPIEVIQSTLTKEELIGFLKGNIIKYKCRAGYKENEPFEKDITKARNYEEWLSIVLKGEKITV